MTKYVCVFALLAFLTGCIAANQYYWGGYDTHMYRHYKNPAQRDEFVQGLKEIVADAEQRGKVPPGIYAEYGFALFEEGDAKQAVLYYEKEAKQWPESRIFMTKLIGIANNRMKSQKDHARPVSKPDDSVPKASAEAAK